MTNWRMLGLMILIAVVLIGGCRSTLPEDWSRQQPGGGGYTLQADTLYAYPMQTTTGVDTAVRVVVATGDPANPFAYLNSVGVLFSGTTASYVSDSFNIGAVGGQTYDSDGIWATMNPQFYLQPDDSLIELSVAEVNNDSTMMVFTVVPVNPTEQATISGELFNFEVQFSQAGVYNIGFIALHQVKRTYYSDDGAAEYDWGNIENNDASVPNTITVQ